MNGILCDLGVAARVVQNHRLLVVQEAQGRFQGLWGLPKGRVDNGELPEEAVLRELREETGLLGAVGGLTGVRTTVRRSTPSIFLCYDVTVSSTDAHADENEIASVRWVNINEIASLQWVSETMQQLGIEALTRPVSMPVRHNLTPRSHPYAVYTSANAVVRGTQA